jgi:serine protease
LRDVQAPSAFRHCVIGILAAFSIASTHAAAATNENNPVRTYSAVASAATEQHVLVKLRASAAAAAHVQALQVKPNQANAANGTMQALALRANLTFKQSREITNGLHLLQVQSATGESVETTLARLRADPAVESADIDQRRFPHALPNDPLFTGQWYEQATQPAGIDAVTAWDTTTGRSDVVIAELDTGVRYDHPDLLAATANGRLLAGYDFITDPVVANDGGGRDADASDPGDWITSAEAAAGTFPGCTTASNSSWHGTRVAGILGALSNNATGITGITWQPKILPVRVLGKCGGVDSDILDGMRWAAGLHVAGVPDNTHPAQIINMSLGAPGACTAAEQTVIDEVVAAGVTVVISAGNDSGPVNSPANCVGVTGIAGIRQSGTKVGFSSLGPEAALAAPAGNCVNATGACLFSIDTTINNGATTPTTSGYTDQLNPNLGTSFSSPIVAGIAGLMTSVNSNLRPAQLIARLKEGAKPFPVSSDPTVPNCHVPASSTDLQSAECNCTTSTCGGGMANAPGAIKAALRPIAAIAVPVTVSAGQNVSLAGTGSAAACNHTISTYAWSNVGNSTNPIQGANTATATVVAPASGSITVRLTVTDDVGRQDTADVTVSAAAATTTAPANANTGKCPANAALPVAVAVTPATATVQAGNGMHTFAAAVTNTSNTAVTWSVNGVAGGNVTVGTISPAGVYKAPASVPTPATVTVTATSAADTTKSGSAQVTVTVPIAVSITPATASVQTGMSQIFAATVTGSSSTTVNWSVNGVAGGNAMVGTISTSGVYTAPMTVPTPATVTVTAVSATDSTKSASAQATVVATAAASTGNGTGSTTSSAGSTGSPGSLGGGSGGGPMDPLTLCACTLIVGFAAYRRGVASR